MKNPRPTLASTPADIAAFVRAHLEAEARATGYDTDGFRVVAEVVPAEVDEDTGDVFAPAYATANAYDLSHHSNVLFVTLEADADGALFVAEVG